MGTPRIAIVLLLFTSIIGLVYSTSAAVLHREFFELAQQEENLQLASESRVRLQSVRRQVLEENKISPDMWDLMQTADRMAAQNRWTEALRILESIMEELPHHIFVIEKTANAAEAGGFPERAIPLLDKLEKQRGTRQDDLACRGRQDLHSGRFGQAEAYLTEALRKNPHHLSARVDLACLMAATGRQHLIGRTLGYLSMNEMATLCYRLAEQEAQLDTILEKDHFDAVIRHIVGGGTTPANIPVEATTNYLLEVHNTLRLMDRAAHGGRFPRALSAMHTAATLGVGGPTYDVASAFLLNTQEGRQQDARAKMEDVLKHYPNWIEGYVHSAVLLSDQGRFNEALQRTREAEKKQRGRVDVAFAHTLALAGAKDLKAAWPILVKLGQVYPAYVNEWLKGDSPARKAIRNDPRYPHLRTQLRAGSAQPTASPPP